MTKKSWVIVILGCIGYAMLTAWLRGVEYAPTPNAEDKSQVMAKRLDRCRNQITLLRSLLTKDVEKALENYEYHDHGAVIEELSEVDEGLSECDLDITDDKMTRNFHRVTSRLIGLISFLKLEKNKRDHVIKKIAIETQQELLGLSGELVEAFDTARRSER